MHRGTLQLHGYTHTSSLAAGGGVFRMAGCGGRNGGGGLYAVLGVASDCSDAELRSAYRKLAMKWHPDKRAAAGSSGDPEAAKARFQKIQIAYAVLSDPNKRILYDVGAYDSDDDDDGAGEILGDILEAMDKTAATENGEGESLEELQMQFEELFLRPDPGAARLSKLPSSSSTATFCSGQDEAGKSSTSKRRTGRKDLNILLAPVRGRGEKKTHAN